MNRRKGITFMWTRLGFLLSLTSPWKGQKLILSHSVKNELHRTGLTSLIDKTLCCPCGIVIPRWTQALYISKCSWKITKRKRKKLRSSHLELRPQNQGSWMPNWKSVLYRSNQRIVYTTLYRRSGQTLLCLIFSQILHPSDWPQEGAPFSHDLARMRSIL